ncbi:MAG TPA: IS21 family transposase, partial [Ghiorsea sp.]|nr:IS21 family transposase [Ghiorsea sp.]
MVTDQQVKKLRKLIQMGKTQEIAAMKSGMDVKTARKYIQTDTLPSEMFKPRDWRTRADAFKEDWPEIENMLDLNSGFQALTLFKHLQSSRPGKYADGQLRAFQNRVREWRSLHGPSKEVMFPQIHYPGQLSQSDFTHMDSLKVTLLGKRFDHLIYHFVLTYSNWETGSVCFSESFESLSVGFQKALWELGGVPIAHQTDQLSAAVQKMGHRDEFTDRYQALLRHYGTQGRKIEVRKPNQNGDVEQSHYRFKQALEQALLLRGSRDFESRGTYELFLKVLFKQKNKGRTERFNEELNALKPLPKNRLSSSRLMKKKVRPSSTIRVEKNTYSIHSSLINETVDVRLYAERLEIWYGRKHVESLPRLRGENKYRVDYRHVIDSLMRKP